MLNPVDYRSTEPFALTLRLRSGLKAMSKGCSWFDKLTTSGFVGRVSTRQLCQLVGRHVGMNPDLREALT